MENNELIKKLSSIKSIKDAKKLIITVLLGALTTLIVEEYRLFISGSQVEDVTIERDKAIKFADKIDSLYEATHKVNMEISKKYIELNNKVNGVVSDNADLTEEALDVFYSDIEVISDSEFDSIRMALRNEYDVEDNF